jgi:hypothetical protein
MLRFLYILSFLFISIFVQAQTTTYHEGLAAYSEVKDGKTKYGFKNKADKVIIAARFDAIAEPFQSGQAIVIVNGLYGTIDTKGKTILSALYKKILPIQFDLYPVQQSSGLWGFFSIDGKQAIPFAYNNFKFTNKSKQLFVQKEGKWGMISRENTNLVPFEYRIIESVSSKQVRGQLFNSWVLMSASGNQKSNYTCDSVAFTAEPTLLTYRLNGWEGLIKLDGTIAVKNTYEEIGDIYGNLIAVKKDLYWGVKNSTNTEWLIEPTYDVIDIDSLLIRTGTRSTKKIEWKLYRHTGQLFYPAAVLNCRTFKNNMLAIQSTNGTWGFLNEKGELAVASVYSKVEDFYFGLCRVEKNGEQFIINKNGDVVLNHQDVYLYSIGLLKLDAHQDKTYTYNIDSQTELIPINAEFVKIKKSNKYGLINTKGETVLPTIYTSIEVGTSKTTFVVEKDKVIKVLELGKRSYSIDKKIISVEGFYNDFAIMKYNNGRFGYIDNIGKIRVAPQYEQARPFNNEVAIVRLNGKWGIIDKNENFVTQPYYDSISNFTNNVCIVSEKGKHYLMDNTGKIVTPDGYTSIIKTRGGNYLLVKNNLKGIANAQGKEIIAVRYQNIVELSSTLFHVTENDLQGVIDANRKIILNVKYHAIKYNPQTQEFLTAEEGMQRLLTIK